MLTDSLKRHIPNALTVLRVALAPAVLFALLGGYNAIALGAFVLAALSDWLDGVLARKWQVTSLFGAALDHTADKILILSAFVALAMTGVLLGFTLLAVMVMLYREFFIASLRESLAGKQVTLPVSFIGKSKTTLQMLSVIALIAFPHMLWIGFALVWISAAISLWSAYGYTRAALAENDR